MEPTGCLTDIEIRRALWKKYYWRSRDKQLLRAKNYRDSPLGKAVRARWEEAHREQRILRKRAEYLRRKKCRTSPSIPQPT
jgi:hypothetical protein